MSEKITGYLLLVAGLAIIFFAAYSVFSTFTGKSKPYQLFSYDGITIDLGSLTSSSQSITVPEEYAEEVIAKLDEIEQSQTDSVKQEILPGPVLNDSLNYFAYIIFMGFLANIGFKVANLGTHMARPIIIKPKMVETKPTPKPSVLVPPKK